MRRDKAAMIVVGDVHGEAAKLGAVLDTFTQRNSTLVFVGDYVNRGQSSREVLDLLVDAKASLGARLVLLRGNHDQALLDFLAGGHISVFAAHGGLATIRSYISDFSGDVLLRFIHDFPQTHRELLMSTRPYLETEDTLVSHVGFNPLVPSSRADEDMYLKAHGDLFIYRGPWPKPLTVCGHYVQSSGRPALGSHLVCVDTGCGSIEGAPLTAVALADMEIVQF
jgi:serine/threonine protein phosphatase 1